MQELSPKTVVVETPRSTIAGPWSGWIGIAVLAVLIYFIRDRHQFSNPQFWAEDATVFLAVSVRDALLDFVHPYAGYFHFGPRTLALIGSFFPVVLAPKIFFYAAVVVAAASCVVIYRMVRTLPAYLRVLFALAPLLVLPAGEVYGNVTNVQWFCGAVFGVLVLTYRADTFRSRGWLALGAALALTGPFSVVFWPCLFAWSLLTRRLRLNAAMLTVVGVGALIQLATIAIMGTNKYGVGFAGEAAWLRAVKIFLATFVTLHGVKAGIAFLAVIALLAYGLYRNLGKLRLGYLPAGLLCMTALTLLMGLWTHKHMPDLLNPLGPGERYYFLPFNFLLMAVIASAPAAGKKYGWLCFLVVVLLIFGWTRHFGKDEQTDFRWRDYYALSQRAPDALIPILPSWVFRPPQEAQDSAVQPVPVDLSGLKATFGELHVDGGGHALSRANGPEGADPQIFFDVPSACLNDPHRFVRVALKDAARVRLFLANADGSFAGPGSQSWPIGAGDHWYYDVPRELDKQKVRLDVASDSGTVVHGLDVSWVCW
ncbi:hypothetical protein [Paraburkholderia sp. BCC1884]|uniref:hypothetical protein n=1 Tax=Paraburkholderia sp. BCC1884 TaxID=2562668 RepID=UPI0011838ED5|nr:hypothetical protein [Paraburkholderia sp. BCC1884]